MDDRTGKHSAKKGMRTDAQQTMANIHVGGETSSFWCLFFSFCHQRMRKTNRKPILPSLLSWLDLTTVKQRRDQKNYFMAAAPSPS
jgi:hypothetical protein